MTNAELTAQLLALAPKDRAEIALRVWESLEDDAVSISPESETTAVKDAQRRDAELSQGQGVRSHDEVMSSARRSLRCE